MGKAAVFACDHSIPVLAKYGIVPTAVVSFDGAGFVYSDVYSGVPLITAVTADPCLTYSWNGPVHFLNLDVPEVLKITEPWWPSNELLLQNCYTVGGSMMSLAMSILYPSLVHFFGYDYCWKDPNKQHAHGLTFRSMENGPIPLKGHLGSDVRTYPGFFQEALMIKSRMLEYKEKTGASYCWYGESIIPASIAGVTQESIEEADRKITETTLAVSGVRWRGAARANSLHPSTTPISHLFDKLKGVKEVVLIGAGPSLDETITQLTQMLGITNDGKT